MSTDVSAGPAAADLPPEAVLQLSEVFKPRSTFRFDVACVGLGYVGLPTALAFHAARSRVLGFDVCAERLALIAAKRVDLLDSDQARLDHALGGDAFTLTDDPGLLAEAQVVIIAVPTPVDEYQLPDLAILRSACASVVANAVQGQIIILTSTSYVGSTQEMLVAPLAARGFTIGEDIHVAFSPERIDPGNDRHAHEDVARVVGGATPECARAAMAALGAYAINLFPVSSAEVAEMTKLFENTFRAVNIALANELAEISRAFKIDVAEVITAAATKPFGFMAFMPGPGVGGHCIPCDPHYLLWQLRRKRLATPIIEQTMQSIASRPLRVVDRVTEVLSLAGRGIKEARVLVLGVAYKPDVQDVRESPAIEIITGLRALGAIVDFHDPLVEVLRLPGGESMKSVADPRQYDADLVLVHTLHQCLDLSWLEDAPLILDTSYRLRELPQLFTL